VRITILFTIALFVLLPPALAGAAERPTIIIQPPEATRNILEVEPEIGQSIADLLSGMLVKRYRFPSADRHRAAHKATGVHPDELHGDLDACAKFARAAGADLVLTGRLLSFGNRMVLHLRLVAIPTEGPAEPKVMVMRSIDQLEDIPDLLPDIVKSFVAAVVPPEQPPVRRPIAVGKTKPRPQPQGLNVEKLLGGLKSKDAGVRFSSAIELGKSGRPEAVPALLPVAKADRDLFVRRAAARSLGDLGDRRAVPVLIELLGDKEFFVAVSANEAIKRITGHDCGIKDGLSLEGRKKILDDARTWWKQQSD
jgi:hypothetical protein